MSNTCFVSQTRNQLIHLVHYLLIIGYAFAIDVQQQGKIDEHLAQAKQMLSTGKYNEALSHFHSVIDIDPNNYLTIFRRATVYLALNRPKPALEDLNRSIQLRPDFASALVNRGNLLVKLGRLDEAHIDFELTLSHDPSNEEALTMYQKVEELKDDLLNIEDLMDEAQYDEALRLFEEVIKSIPWSVPLLKERARAFEKVGETSRAINDYRTIAKLETDVNMYLKISKLSYTLGDIEESLNYVRECLKLDPDNQFCMKHYKPVKKLSNHMTKMIDAMNGKKYDTCYKQGGNSLEIIKNEQHNLLKYTILSIMCHCMSKAGDVVKGTKICADALEDVPKKGGIVDIAIPEDKLLCDYADLLMDKEDYNEALRYYQKSNSMNQSKRAKEGIAKANQVQKQKKKRDYYKILGVRRGASETEINKAYRELASKWHPDRHQDEESKKIAQQKFMDIADAKSVLTDPEKRQLYDRGQDPLDPEAKSQPMHMHPFFGGHPLHFTDGGAGGPFTVKFSFQ